MWRVALTRRPSATLPPSSRNRRTQNESWDSRRRKSLFFNRLENVRTLGSHTLTQPAGAMLKPDHKRWRQPERSVQWPSAPTCSRAGHTRETAGTSSRSGAPPQRNHRSQGLRGPARPRDPRRSSAPVFGWSRCAAESRCGDRQLGSATRNIAAPRTSLRRCRRRAPRFM